MSHIYKLRKNASLKSVAKAVRKQHKVVLAQYRTHKKYMEDRVVDFEFKCRTDEVFRRAMELEMIADHLDRLSGNN